MHERARLFFATPKALLFWLAASTFNNWVLGILLNHRLWLAGGSVSEFSATTQPFHWVFRSLDIISGILFVVIAWVVSKWIARSGWHYLLVASTLILGIGNIVDALLPLPCSGTLDNACSAPVRLNIHRVSLPDHVFSSVLIGFCYILIPLACYFYFQNRRSKHLRLIGLVAMCVTVLFFALLAAESLIENGLIEHLAGYSQELQMLVLGWLFVALGQHSQKMPLHTNSKSS